MQESQGDHLTGLEADLGGCGDGAQLLIDFRDQGGDKLSGRHTALRASQGGHAFQRGRVVGRLQAQTSALCGLYRSTYFMVCEELTPSFSSIYINIRLSFRKSRMCSVCRIGMATIFTLGLVFGCGGDEDEHMLRPGCCLVCTDGKACGDTCIPAILNCLFPPGCACNR